MKLPIISMWIPPHPNNLYRLGVLLGLSYDFLVSLDSVSGDTFFTKCYKLLMAAFKLTGDNFPSKLLQCMEHLRMKGSYIYMIEQNQMEDPFTSACPPGCHQDVHSSWNHMDMEQGVLAVCVQVAHAIAQEPGIDCLCCETFGTSAILPELDCERNMALKLFKIMAISLQRMETEHFLGKLKELVLQVSQAIVFNDVVDKEVPLPPDVKSLFYIDV